MTQINHAFIVDGDENALGIAMSLGQALIELEKEYNLTIFVKDVTLDRNPHGNGMWQYLIKVTKNAN